MTTECFDCGLTVEDGGDYCDACTPGVTAEYEADRERETAREMQRLLREIPPRAHLIPDLPMFARRDVEARKAALAVGSWLAGDVAPLWLHGPPGVGKTTLAALAAVAVQGEAGARVKWVPVYDVVKAGAKPPPSRATLVVLDDVGTHAFTPTKCARLFEWSDRLYGEGVPVLVTSNMRPSQLAERVTKGMEDENAGERLVRRLRGDCAGEVVEVAGPFRAPQTGKVKGP